MTPASIEATIRTKLGLAGLAVIQVTRVSPLRFLATVRNLDGTDLRKDAREVAAGKLREHLPAWVQVELI